MKIHHDLVKILSYRGRSHPGDTGLCRFTTFEVGGLAAAVAFGVGALLRGLGIEAS